MRAEELSRIEEDLRQAEFDHDQACAAYRERPCAETRDAIDMARRRLEVARGGGQ